MSEKLDVYTRVTNKIIADLERGNLTWLQPWQAGHQAGPVSRPLRAGGKAYRGVNVLMLWAAAMEKGYNCPLWLTYKQAAELGGQVRKGEKGSRPCPTVWVSIWPMGPYPNFNTLAVASTLSTNLDVAMAKPVYHA
jgi:antirestriction protein ArdC